jgi:hypothetical protein
MLGEFVELSLIDISFLLYTEHRTLVRDDPDEHNDVFNIWKWNAKFQFRVSYHSQMFANVQVRSCNMMSYSSTRCSLLLRAS